MPGADNAGTRRAQSAALSIRDGNSCCGDHKEYSQTKFDLDQTRRTQLLSDFLVRLSRSYAVPFMTSRLWRQATTRRSGRDMGDTVLSEDELDGAGLEQIAHCGFQRARQLPVFRLHCHAERPSATASPGVAAGVMA
jgi:hypothetical protein